MMLLTEGAHFTIMPNAIKQLYGEKMATKVYAVLITYTGTCSVAMLFIVSSNFGKNYTRVFNLSGLLSLFSLTILLTCYPSVDNSEVLIDKADHYKVIKELKINKQISTETIESSRSSFVYKI